MFLEDRFVPLLDASHPNSLQFPLGLFDFPCRPPYISNSLGLRTFERILDFTTTDYEMPN